MKQSMFSKQGQKGFTLLELLVVVAIIAILSLGAILAYDGLTDTAKAAATANNTATADQSIRNYRVVTGEYPNQWDHLLAQDDGATLDFVADETYDFLGSVNANSLSAAIINAFENVGIEEFQARSESTVTSGLEPNLQLNEGAAPGDATEIELEEGQFPTRLLVLPTGGKEEAVVCSTPDEAIQNSANDGTLTYATIKNFSVKVNDSIGEEECHLIVAVGFGMDAAHSTASTNVAIANAPAYSSDSINPADNYARYIALFDVAKDGEDESEDGGADNEDGVIQASEVYNKARFIGLLTPDGKVIDESQAAANDTTPES